MGKKRNGDTEDPADDMNERAMFFRLLDIFSSDNTTDEQRLRIYEAAEKISADPIKPDTPNDDKDGA